MNQNTNVDTTEESWESISQGDEVEAASEATVCLRSYYLKGSTQCTNKSMYIFVYLYEEQASV